MESKAKILGHPAHQILIVFPLGLLATSVVFDVVYLVTGTAQWATISFWMIASGLIGGLVAAPFGLIDWLAIPKGTRARSVGRWHGIGNVIVLALFGVSLALRWTAEKEPGMAPIALSFMGVGLALLTGWLGGELVDRLGVGVDDGAHLNSPNSLSGRSASESSTSKTSDMWPSGSAGG